jgi:hypothetical protein
VVCAPILGSGLLAWEDYSSDQRLRIAMRRSAALADAQRHHVPASLSTGYGKTSSVSLAIGGGDLSHDAEPVVVWRSARPNPCRASDLPACGPATARRRLAAGFGGSGLSTGTSSVRGYGARRELITSSDARAACLLIGCGNTIRSLICMVGRCSSGQLSRCPTRKSGALGGIQAMLVARRPSGTDQLIRSGDMLFSDGVAGLFIREKMMRLRTSTNWA